MIRLKGKITDNTGAPIFNAHVIFLDQTLQPGSPLMGTVTNFDGEYEFETLGGYAIKITHVSYMSKTVEFDAPTSWPVVINTSLKPSNNQLPEVEIIGKIGNWITQNKAYVFAGLAIVLFGAVSHRFDNEE